MEAGSIIPGDTIEDLAKAVDIPADALKAVSYTHLDVYKRQIPHLYAAGECGSVTARNAQSGGNLAECIVFGKRCV